MENYSEINYENNIKMLNEAISYCSLNLSHDELIKELSCSNDIKKQLCIIEIKKINSQKEADLLVNNLTGKSGPIREVCSFKILELISDKNYQAFFQTKEIIDILTKGITDINPSVSRNIVEAIKYINNSDYLINNIISEINNTLSELDSVSKNRSYTLNKKNFNIYWNMEALINLSGKIKINDAVFNIIKITAESSDYTIREKTAKLIYELNSNILFENIINLLKTDKNIYVSKYFKAES